MLLIKNKTKIHNLLQINLMNSFSSKILKWYSQNRRDFPWRKTKNPYKIWLSEIILQQTKTEQGLSYYQKFTITYPTIFDLANAQEQEVLKLWQGLGYYSRARNLYQSAKYIAFNLNGNFPNNYNDLIQLKGVGDYTASAIASICFNEREAVLDGNVFRVLSRYFGIKTDISSGKGKKEFKKLALQLLPKEDFADYNQALMDFGAMQCTPKKTNCTSCILKDSCYAFLNHQVDKFPFKKKKNPVKKRYFNYLVILDANNKTLFKKRTKKDIWQNLYEFPLIESEKKITLKMLKNKIRELNFLNTQQITIALYNETEIIHKLSHQHIYTSFWIIHTPEILKNSYSFKDIKSFPVATLTHNFIEFFTNS